MTADEAIGLLEEVRDAMVEQFSGNEGRLHQLTHHLATAAMAVEHLFDEEHRTAGEA